MNNLNIKANKSFYHGFVLTEQELRRFNDLVIEQLKKDSSESVGVSYSMMYENGIVGQTNEIEEVLSQENSGSSKISELSILYSSKNKREILIQFTNVNADNASSNISIKYNIKSSSRDWGFITSSILDERISKIKRFSLNFSPKAKGIKLFITTIFPIIFILGMISPMIYSMAQSKTKLNEIRNDWKSKELTDPIETMIRIQEMDSSFLAINGLKYAVFSISAFIILLICLLFYFQKFYPVYNFCWGDYVETFKKKESIRKTINVVIVIGLIVSIIGGLIANKIGG